MKVHSMADTVFAVRNSCGGGGGGGGGRRRVESTE